MKNKFIAETSITKDLVKKDDLTPEVSRDYQKIQTYNINEYKFQQLINKVERSLNSSQKPSDCFFVWSAERQVQKKRLDVEHQRLILEEIRNLGLTVQEYANTEAYLFLMPELVQDIIDGHRAKVKLAAKEFSDNLKRIDDEAKTRQLANSRVEAEIRQLAANSRLTELQGNLLQKVLSELDLKNITTEQAFVLVKALNPQANADVDFAMVNAQMEKFKAETEFKFQQARQQKYTADEMKHELEETVREDNKRKD